MGINIYENFNNIYYVSQMEKELSKLTKGKKDFAKWLRNQLAFLDAEGVETVLQRKPFEKLTNQELYKIKHISPHNERILYFATVDENVILLTAFCEKNKSDYRLAIDLANQRKNKVLKELEK